MTGSRPLSPTFVAATDAPLIGERAAARGRSANGMFAVSARRHSTAAARGERRDQDAHGDFVSRGIQRSGGENRHCGGCDARYEPGEAGVGKHA